MSIARVLILEDLAETRRWLSGIVQEAFPGCSITEASSLREGLAAARTASFGPACQGRLNVPAPNTSLPGQQKVCHMHTAKRRWSSMRSPMTIHFFL